VIRPAPTSGSVAARRPGTADRWINFAAVTTVAGLAGIAGALSYSHMRRLAQDHGQAGWLPWTALALGMAGSLAANIATAHHDPVSRIIAGWPAVALLIAVKLLSGILEHRDARQAAPPMS
jgi:hypothetical protein